VEPQSDGGGGEPRAPLTLADLETPLSKGVGALGTEFAALRSDTSAEFAALRCDLAVQRSLTSATSENAAARCWRCGCIV
jgi:hypothetical protein